MRYLSMTLLVLLLSTGSVLADSTPDAAVTTTDGATTRDVVTSATDAGPVSDVKATDVKASGVTVEVVSKPGVPTTDKEAGALVSLLLDSAENGQWTVFAGLLLLLLMWLFNRLGLASKVGRDYVPWVTMGVSAAGFIAIALVEGSSVNDALKLGLLEGGIAIALWELVFKRFTTAKTDGSLRVKADTVTEG